jgi:adenylylsulfate kinase-like enzyme
MDLDQLLKQAKEKQMDVYVRDGDQIMHQIVDSKIEYSEEDPLKQIVVIEVKDL